MQKQRAFSVSGICVVPSMSLLEIASDDLHGALAACTGHRASSFAIKGSSCIYAEPILGWIGAFEAGLTAQGSGQQKVNEN